MAKPVSFRSRGATLGDVDPEPESAQACGVAGGVAGGGDRRLKSPGVAKKASPTIDSGFCHLIHQPKKIKISLSKNPKFYNFNITLFNNIIFM